MWQKKFCNEGIRSFFLIKNKFVKIPPFFSFLGCNAKIVYVINQGNPFPKKKFLEIVQCLLSNSFFTQ
ncbi:photosystem II protein K [Iris pallida]|uniref:Photosystem II protein K (Chloroplast) n=1 Tax=Iris pallida TaxID=29817 RepID=A0AAX6FQ50_IRIPA|nr:photosystem II protein K [Iris pallida]